MVLFIFCCGDKVGTSLKVFNKAITSEEARSLSWQEKCKLIKSDPVTCARYFDHRVQIFVNNVLKHKSMPVGKVIDYFFRVEFQQRGSPHIHMLLWIENALVHGNASDTSVVSFVDKYVTCQKADSIPELINYQTHRHASTCKKRGKNVCRFDFPIFPMPETTILYPPDSQKSKEEYTDAVQKIISLLNDLQKSGTVITFEQFLQQLDIDFPMYLEAVRSTLRRAKVFLKRTVFESRINKYNGVLIRGWMASMDLQYIFDPFSCVSYIVSYISKGQRGLSNLLQDACTEAQLIDSDIRQQVRRIGNQFLSSVEVGAQEAVYLVLQLPLRRSTRDVVYIDTKQAADRTVLIKPLSKLKEMPNTSHEVETDSGLKRYMRRPKSMEKVCYADFISWYDLCLTKRPKDTEPQCMELPETEYECDRDDDIAIDEDVANSSNKVIRFPCGTCIRKRHKQKVIYTHMATLNTDREDYFRQKILLYTHWRQEDDLLSNFSTFESSFCMKAAEINLNKQSYEKCSVDELEIQGDITDQCLASAINCESQHQDAIDKDEGMSRADELGCFDPGAQSNELGDYDLGEDIGANIRHIPDPFPHNEISNEDFSANVQQLNDEQRRFFYHILHCVKINALPLYIFLSGGAGVGKSVVVRCIYQGLLKYLNHQRNEEPDTCKVLLCAPTGKAAHNIGGMTIHSAFCNPANQGFHFKPLDMQQLNTMRSRYHSLKVVIIDEISMVGRSMMNFINLRLQEITACTIPFGNVSILAVGDLYQLKPVADSWIFAQNFSVANLTALATNLWVQLFDFFELKQVMRQKDDLDYANLLNRLREGLYTEEDMSLLQTRQIAEGTDDCFKALPHLFCTRKDVFEHNACVLEEMPADEKVTIMAVDEISGDISPSLREILLSKIPADSKLTMGLQKTLTLGIGLPTEISLNIDTEDGLTNGAACYVRKFDFRVPHSSRCSIVWVQFEDALTGRNWRARYRHLYNEHIPISWTPILETCRKFTFKHYKSYLVARRQFPLYLSAGKTVHKAQGSTIHEAVLHFGSRKIDHVHYVGLSRLTSLSGVHIKQLNISKISVSSDVETEMSRLRFEKTIQCVPQNLKAFEQSVFTVCFHNCRSLQQHFLDFKAEANLLSSHIIGLAETRIGGISGDQFSINGFRMINPTMEQVPHGIAVYFRETLNIEQIDVGSLCGVEYILVGMEHTVAIAFVYCPPRTSTVTNLSCFLTYVLSKVSTYLPAGNKNLVLMGDFNFDHRENASVSKLFKQTFQLNQLETSDTTDYGSCIDHIYSSLCAQKVVTFGTLESYYSDHKPVFLSFYMK